MVHLGIKMAAPAVRVAGEERCSCFLVNGSPTAPAVAKMTLSHSSQGWEKWTVEYFMHCSSQIWVIFKTQLSDLKKERLCNVTAALEWDPPLVCASQRATLMEAVWQLLEDKRQDEQVRRSSCAHYHQSFCGTVLFWSTPVQSPHTLDTLTSDLCCLVWQGASSAGPLHIDPSGAESRAAR